MNTSTKPKTSSRRVLYATMGLLLAVLLFGIGGVLWLSGGSANNALSIGGPFTLEDGNGQPVTDVTFRGKYMLVYFGYTFCPDVCPTTLNAVADAMDKLSPEAAARIQPLFITVDPKRDTPAVVKRYATAFGPRIMGLTGTADQVAKIAKEYRVYYAEHRTGPGPDDYSMDHSSVLYLMNPAGGFVAPLRADQSGDGMAVALKKLIAEG